MTSCSVNYCKNKASKGKNISFFRFPPDPLLKKIWIENCYSSHLPKKDSNIEYKNYRVCGAHFEDKMFLNPRLRNRLVFNAVPTIFRSVAISEKEEEHKIKEQLEFEIQALNESCCSSDTEHKTNTISSFDNVPTYHIKNETSESSSEIPLLLPNISSETMKLLNEIETKNQEIKDLKEKLNIATQQLIQVNTVEQMLKLCKLHLSPSLFLFVNTHINHRSKKVKDIWYCNQILELAKTIYLLSPLNVYKFLQSILPLPAPPVLKRLSNLNDTYLVLPK